MNRKKAEENIENLMKYGLITNRDDFKKYMEEIENIPEDELKVVDIPKENLVQRILRKMKR